jgi:glycosyltransferase involved in cell wall biosynthesis
MIHFFLNAGSASAGGGLTYLRNFATHLLGREDVRATILLTPEGRQVVAAKSSHAGSSRLRLVECPWQGSAVSRFWREQRELPPMIRSSGADVLLSTGNIALRNSPVPQILLSRNALYTSPEFFDDLRRRRDYALLAMEAFKSLLAKRSIRWADCTVAPSRAFAEQLKMSTGHEIVAVNHGFDAAAFFASDEISEELHDKLKAAEGCVRLLFVSHYNYYRNFETLLRALPSIRRQLAPRRVRLFLTCRFGSELNPGSYRADSAAALVQELGIEDEVVQLGAVPYRCLHHLYRACDLYITPAYAESFAHPLVEAMASRLPIVASDLPVHREICRDAAIYAATFSPSDFAQRIVSVIEDRELSRHLALAGLRRSADFSWADHVGQIIRIAEQLTSAKPFRVPRAAALAS